MRTSTFLSMLIGILPLAQVPPAFAQEAPASLLLGKKPLEEISSDPPLTDTFGKKPLDDSDETQLPDQSSPDAPIQTLLPPAPFTSLQNAVRFILSQRGLQGTGLPATFYVPAGVRIENAQRELIVSEGVGLYDTALAVITLVDADRLTEAKQILDFYVEGRYAPNNPIPMELGAYPASNNGESFDPFDADAHYFFDFTNVYGSWARWGRRWEFWTAHTGPNAWMINALVRYIDAARRRGDSDLALQPYRQTAEQIGQAMLRLQDAETYGGIRYAPRDTFHEDGTSDPYLEINSENNVSAYTALRMLAQLTGNSRYDMAAHQILMWFHDAPVWTADGKRRRGLWDPQTGAFAMGVTRQGNHWVLQTDHPTDSGGTWTISALGPAKIDELWGRGAAYRMWEVVRKRAGRTPQFKYIDEQSTLAGLDYNDAFPPNESLISPEWTAGGLFAIQQLLQYYDPSKNVLTTMERARLRQDAEQMTAYIRLHSNAYAWGPGHQGLRAGQTGFHWYCPPPEVHAMASIYVALYLDGQKDPTAWWRQHGAPVLDTESMASAKN